MVRTPPPVSKARPSTQRGGRTERHGLSSPHATLNSVANKRAKSDGVPRWGCLSRARLVTPTRCVQRLRSAVAHVVRSAIADLNRGRIALPPLNDEGDAFVI